MSRTPLLNVNRASYVKLPEIGNHEKTTQILEYFDTKRRSVSKATLMEAEKKKIHSPSKANFITYQYAISK